MKFKFLKAANVGLFLSTFFMSNVANSVIITETWQGTVYLTNNPLMHNLNDVLSWTATYDDESLKFNIYQNGPDGKAGTDDDTLDEVIDSSCPGVWCGYQLLADAVFDFSALFLPVYEQMELAGVTPYTPNTGWYRNLATRVTNYPVTAGYYKRDAETVGFEFSPIYGSNGGFHVAVGQLEMYQFFMSDIRIINVTTTSLIPEPSTLSIFALAFMGLASRRFKKQ